MQIITLYLATAAICLAIDVVGLTYLLRPMFERELGDLLLEDFRLGPAILFYSFYIGCLIWFVSRPAIRQNKPLIWVFGSAALLGGFGYGTYEFTNLATLKAWTWGMVITDLIWGVLLTGVSTTLGVAVTRMATQRLSPG